MAKAEEAMAETLAEVEALSLASPLRSAQMLQTAILEWSLRRHLTAKPPLDPCRGRSGTIATNPVGIIRM